MRISDSNGGVNHIVPFSNGCLSPEHIAKIGPAFPLFLKLEDMVTTGDGTDGLVWGGRPVTDQLLADELGKHRKTIADWRRRLMRHGYVVSKSTPVGNLLRVRKSKKWQWLSSGKASSKTIEVGAEPLPGGSQTTPRWERKREGVGAKTVGGGIENGNPNKTVAGQKQDVGAAATSECWKAIGKDLPMGTVPFQRVWEFFFASKNGEPLSEAMERAIQRAQKQRIAVPRPFYDAKRTVEEREKEQAVTEPAPANRSVAAVDTAEKDLRERHGYVQ